ncbi:MAG: hypothetical protein ACLFTZ_01250 [Acholeplasmataceae bacterium]
MNRMYLVLLFLCLFLLASCDETPVCDDDETLEDGACVPIDDRTIALREAIETMQGLNSFRLSVELSRGEEQQTMDLAFDDDRSWFEVDDYREYYERTADGCFEYVPTTDGYLKESYDCSHEPALFYLDFSSDMFTYIDQAYYLDYQHLDRVSAFFKTEMAGSTASNFVLTVADGYFDRFNLDVNHDGAIWNVTMAFSDFDSVEIDLEEVAS